jgi:hypothetical protein
MQEGAQPTTKRAPGEQSASGMRSSTGAIQQARIPEIRSPRRHEGLAAAYLPACSASVRSLMRFTKPAGSSSVPPSASVACSSSRLTQQFASLQALPHANRQRGYRLRTH